VRLLHQSYHRLNLQNDPNDTSDDDDDDDDNDVEPLLYNDFEDFNTPEQQQKQTNEQLFQATSLNKLISKSKEKEIQRDNRLAQNWRCGNWNVRGFALDRNSLSIRSSPSPTTTTTTNTTTTATSRLPKSNNRGNDPTTIISREENKKEFDIDNDNGNPPPVMISKVVMDETSHLLGNDYGSTIMGEGTEEDKERRRRRMRMHNQIVAVGRSDGTIYLVRMGLDYMTKFMAVPKLVLEGQWDDDDGGINNKVENRESAANSRGDGEVVGPSVRIESEMVREDAISFPIDNAQRSTNIGQEGENEIGMMDDILAPAYSDDDDERDHSQLSRNDALMPFEILSQFPAQYEGDDDDDDVDAGTGSSTAISSMLFHDDILYTAGGNTGLIKVWDISDNIEAKRRYSLDDSDREMESKQQRRPRDILGGMDVHTDQIIALKSLTRKAMVGGDIDVEEHDLLLSVCLDGSFALWDMVGDDDGDGDSLVYHGVVGVVSSGNDGSGSDTLEDSARIQCADVDVLSRGEYVIYFGLSSGHVVGYIVSDLIDHANKIKREGRGAESQQRSPQHPIACCQFLAHECTKSTTAQEGLSHRDKKLQNGVTALTCGGEGSLAISPGDRGSTSTSTNTLQRLNTRVLLTGGADGTVKQFEIIPRNVEQPPHDYDNDGGSGLKLEHWPRLSTQRMNRRAHMFRGHDGPITALVCGSSSGGVGVGGGGSSSSKILSAGMDGTVRVWNPFKGGNEIYRMDGFTDSLSSLCLDGEILVTDGMDDLVCVHDFDVGEENERGMYEF